MESKSWTEKLGVYQCEKAILNKVRDNTGTELMHEVIAVSYTHLDVYKRQVHSISSRYVIYSLFICFIFLSPCLIDIILILAFRRAELISLTACDKCPATVLTQLHIAVRIRKHKRKRCV